MPAILITRGGGDGMRMMKLEAGISRYGGLAMVSADSATIIGFAIDISACIYRETSHQPPDTAAVMWPLRHHGIAAPARRHLLSRRRAGRRR